MKWREALRFENGQNSNTNLHNVSGKADGPHLPGFANLGVNIHDPSGVHCVIRPGFGLETWGSADTLLIPGCSSGGATYDPSHQPRKVPLSWGSTASLAQSPSDSRTLSTVGRFVGSCCQQAVVNSHSLSVYSREVVKVDFLGLAPLIICKTTDRELHTWNGRLSVRTWEELSAKKWC